MHTLKTLNTMDVEYCTIFIVNFCHLFKVKPSTCSYNVNLKGKIDMYSSVVQIYRDPATMSKKWCHPYHVRVVK